MAKSDWDSLCIDEFGKSFTGPFVNKEGNSVEIYKNWAYIQSPKMWTEGDSSFTKPTIAQMSEGCITLAGFDIYIGRGQKQNSVFVLVISYKPGDKFEKKIEGGIGSYGWEDDVEIVLKSLGRTNEINQEWRSGWSSEDGNLITNLDTGEEISHNYETKYIGVTEDSLNEYKAWLKNLELGQEVENWIKEIEKNRQIRFNQFDGSSSVSEIGKEVPDEPLIIKILKQAKK